MRARGRSTAVGLALWMLAPGCASETGGECRAETSGAVDLAYTRYAEPRPSVQWPASDAAPALVWATGTTGSSTIQAAFFDARGALHGETTISAATGYNTGARLARTAAFSGVVWQRRVQDAQHEVLFQRLNGELARELTLDVVVGSIAVGTNAPLTLAALPDGAFYVGWVDATRGAVGRRVGSDGVLGATVELGGQEPFEAFVVGGEIVPVGAGARVVRLSPALTIASDVVLEGVDVAAPSRLEAASHGDRLGLAWNGSSGLRFAEIDAGGDLLCGPIALSGAGRVQAVAARSGESALVLRRDADFIVQPVAAGCREGRAAVTAASALATSGVTSAAWSAVGLALVWEDLPYGVQGCIVQPAFCDESFK